MKPSLKVGEGKPAQAEERHGANSPPSTSRMDRAPRLRRIAQLIDERAALSSNPARARAIACAMRLRASALEAGAVLSERDEAIRLLSEMFDEPAE